MESLHIRNSSNHSLLQSQFHPLLELKSANNFHALTSIQNQWRSMKKNEPLLSCGGGTRFKVRECVIPDVRNVQQCDGSDKITEQCNQNPCPLVTEWSPWSECSRSCGGGSRSKRRECVYPKNYEPDNDCLEQLEMSEPCNENVCPEYTEWSEWTECTKVSGQFPNVSHFINVLKTCGGGRRRKVRECVLPRSVGGCSGEAELEETCNDQACPSWTPWTSWTQVCTQSYHKLS